jgi:hypothetical protein
MNKNFIWFIVKKTKKMFLHQACIKASKSKVPATGTMIRVCLTRIKKEAPKINCS